MQRRGRTEGHHGMGPGYGSRRTPRAVLISALLACLLAAVDAAPAPVSAPSGGAGLRTNEDISRTLALGPHAGECDRCHSMHSGGSIPAPYALVGPDDNSLCEGCHSEAWSHGSYGGPLTYFMSAHGSNPAMVWPGPSPPARTEPNARNKCVNCHDPHGRTDAAGLIPSLLYVREEGTCLTCHDGTPAQTNVRTQTMKAFRHPTTDYTGRHSGPMESQPTDFGTTPFNRRHAECEDCHNAHVARSDQSFTDPDRPSNTLLGTSRVVPLYGLAGAAPAYQFVTGEDTLTGPPSEAQVCFKCHSSWTSQPSGQTDLPRVLNPSNPSFHPVEDMGRNTLIQAAAFTPGWSTMSRTGCGDCHGDDFNNSAGPHGSNYRYILRRPYTASSAIRTMTSGELCFSCHAYDVYANPSSSDAVRAASRFNKPGVDKGHAEHVGDKRVPCYTCHVTHGSTTQKHLIATGRFPGLNAYTEAPAGGSCTPSCHGLETYAVNYAR